MACGQFLVITKFSIFNNVIKSISNKVCTQMYPNVKRSVWRLDIQELLKSLSDEFHYNLEIISLSHIRDILIDKHIFWLRPMQINKLFASYNKMCMM